MPTPTFLPPKRRSANKDNMIPLINIVFLLLIFFMVAGQMKQPQAENLELPTTRLGQQLDRQGIQLEYNRDQQLFVQGEAVALEVFTQQLLNGDLGQGGFRLRADQSLTAAQLDQLLDTFRLAKINQVQLVTEQPGAEGVRP